MKKVFIVGWAGSFVNMFEAYGYQVVDNIEEADLVQFTGGADVSPSLYGEARHPLTHCDAGRDREEQEIFAMCRALDKPMVGVCRGGQFLNVMSGGRMFQDVRGHGIQGHHEVLCLETNERIQVTSTHHQMMRVGAGGRMLAVAVEIGRNKQFMDGNNIVELISKEPDAEAIWYEDTKCLCFQPHPEYGYAKKECTDLYMGYINKYI